MSKTHTTAGSMLVYVALFEGYPTFKMLPLTSECPFNEIVFDPRTGTLAIVSKDQKDRNMMVEKIGKDGSPIPIKGRLRDGEPATELERRTMAQYYEYYVQNKEDQKAIVNHFALNPEHAALAVIDRGPMAHNETDAEA
jgi:hypothetical protein